MLQNLRWFDPTGGSVLRCIGSVPCSSRCEGSGRRGSEYPAIAASRVTSARSSCEVRLCEYGTLWPFLAKLM